MQLYNTREEYRQAWQDAYEKDPPVPLNVDIELASVCNLECPFCFISDKKFDEFIKEKSYDGDSRRRLMPRDLAYRIIDECAVIGVPALKFNWRGESTIHPYYSDILHYARRKANLDLHMDHECGRDCTFYKDGEHRARVKIFDLLVNTNANCKDHAIDGLMSATKVMVSLDSCIPETYAKMRVGGSLKRAIEVTRELVNRGHENVWVRRVITKDNEHEHFPSHVRGIFGDKVKISEHYCFDRNAKENHEVDYDQDLERQYCGYPSQRIVIASDGMCYPCCIDLHNTMPVGDIKKQSLIAVWAGRLMVMLRNELRSDILTSESCKNCQSWMGYRHDKRNYVQDKEVVRR